MEPVEGCASMTATELTSLGLMETEDFERIYTAALRRGGKRGRWYDDCGKIDVTLCSRDSVSRTFIFSWRFNGRSFKEMVCARPQECHLGGKRWWLGCPAQKNVRDITGQISRVTCERPGYALYFRYGRFGCRDCQNLTYDSSQRGKKMRALYKASFG